MLAVGGIRFVGALWEIKRRIVASRLVRPRDRATHPAVEQAADRQRVVADGLGRETKTALAGKQPVGGIAL